MKMKKMVKKSAKKPTKPAAWYHARLFRAAELLRAERGRRAEAERLLKAERTANSKLRGEKLIAMSEKRQMKDRYDQKCKDAESLQTMLDLARREASAAHGALEEAVAHRGGDAEPLHTDQLPLMVQARGFAAAE
eukprot:TRINITY_DN29110_c0_g1_i1.p4 TRINITY_DN29110_c0_g1~~TRINITY_DN29110_c0_g1_i1.p4  ORF type:complete len:135 (+),score=55.30 TRINITY_DN29110_c0_g1_i1:79-483(+)